MNRRNLAFDASSKRWTDENGFLHVDVSHVSKEQVAPYWGREIPGWQERGLDPEKMYWGYRPAEELAKAAATINGLPILWGHRPESAENPQLEHRVGSMGTDGAWRPPYLDNSLIFTVSDAIAAVQRGEERELSLSYRYEPDFTPGIHEGQPYDFVMRNIRGNHLAVVPEGRAGADVAVADQKLQPKPKESTMGKSFKKFRGAHDADPEVEKQEVDLAQAIIDLHKIDPATGEIVDITEDEDKAAEIRKLVGEFAGQLPPEAVKKLTDALTDLAYSKPTGDAEDPEEQRAFAEGVDYGEKKEKAEPRKLDREHESEGTRRAMDEEMRTAMDKTGCDADDPEQQRAFAEGVKYGERLERDPAERKKLDREHESEGARRALDADEVVEAASDVALRRMQSLWDAQAAVRPYVGELNVKLARDDASTVYGAALDALGIDRHGQPRAAWRGMFQVAVAQKSGGPRLAQDAAPQSGALAGLNKITVL